MRLRSVVASAALMMLVVSPVPSIVVSFQGAETERMISHAFGAMSLMCMCLSIILSARPVGLDWAFGGLDKAYVVHKWLGISALGTLLLHDALESEVDGLKSEITLWGLDWHDLGSDMGVWVYNGLLVLLAVTFLRMIPYRWWYGTHRFMVAMFVLSVLHFIVVPKPLLLANAGSLYLLGWCVLGLIAGAFALRPARWRRGLVYKVQSIQKVGAVTSIWLAPSSRGRLNHRAGQFVNLQGQGKARAEWHPFTISSSPQWDGRLRITFAKRERWTKDLAQTVAAEDLFRLRGPHGRFFPSGATRRQIWLSAGVGLAPHLAWAGSGFEPKGQVDIIHICRDRAVVPHLDEIEAFANRHAHVTLKVYETGGRGRPDARDLLRLIRDRSETADIFYCGPEGLKKTLSDALASAVKGHYEVHSDVFEYRTALPVPGWIMRAWTVLKDAARDMRKAQTTGR